jgi:hypothetical protein
VRREQKAAAKGTKFGTHFTEMYRFPRILRRDEKDLYNPVHKSLNAIPNP